MDLIEIYCRSCGYLLQIESLPESGETVCPFCGEAVMTGAVKNPGPPAAMRYHKDLDYILRAIQKHDKSKSVDDLLSYLDCLAEVLLAEFKGNGDFVHLLRKPTRKQARMALREVLKEGPLSVMKFIEKLSELFPELKECRPAMTQTKQSSLRFQIE